ncbi:MAG: exosortase system-associated protein, TIGR04073 family [Gammaproteobacteria bacterium]|nr:MAG: exosortase system-associated protein, TIGR04073 family [Gammaproteobacteria bacterium]
MKFNKTILLALLTSIFLSFSSLSIADVSNTEMSSTAAPTETSYGSKIGQKALWGLSNTTLGIFEVPKNIIIVTNKSNILYGLTAGLGLGALNTIGRTVVGVNDLLFFLLPTKPIVNPTHPWDNYLDVDTNYDDIFVLDF